MSALYGRAFARDFIDIDATLRSGRYTRQALLTLVQRADRGFDPRVFADALGQATLLDPDDFASTVSPVQRWTISEADSPNGAANYSTRRNPRDPTAPPADPAAPGKEESQ
nr:MULTISPECIES: hypothetical protein [Micromonospora]